MNFSHLFIFLLPTALFAVPKALDFTPQPQVPYLSPEEFLKTVKLPEGYSLELVLSEPQIKEPVAIAFDPDGAMYVAEMRTYMQDINATDEITPQSIVSKHVSTKGDGKFDQHSVYLDKILLPRMILPLDDRILLGTTNTSNITVHRDTNHDGKADENQMWYLAGARGGNMEHQPSGLVWGLDNWIYTTYNSYRIRWNGENNTPLKELTPPNGGQWGLAQDNYGKMWWSNAGGEKGPWHYQTPVIYGAFDVPSFKEKDFDVTHPLVGVRDFQGGVSKSRDDGTLNHFTGCGGQTIYRGDRLPKELDGNLFLPEPVGRLIRRATIHEEDGVTTLKNAHPESEFLRSTDLCFRPINMTTGPDGSIYIVDMYRGIIQEGNWVKKGAYLRKVVEQYGFQNNVGRGRIWRLVHKDFKPDVFPKMLQETPEQWVQHLAHPNGWWRDTAQRLLVVKGDKSVVPSLIKMMTSHENHLAKIHALWTLEGLQSLTAELVRNGMKDQNEKVRIQSMRAAESLIKNGELSLVKDIENAARDENTEVKIQSLLSLKLLEFPSWKNVTQTIMSQANKPKTKEFCQAILAAKTSIPNYFTKEQKEQYLRGMNIYQEICFACHGSDGNGTPIADHGSQLLAPPLALSKTVQQGDAMSRVLLNGLEGAIEGKTYESQMIPQSNYDDQSLADIISFVRNSFGNRASFVKADEIKKVRNEVAHRSRPWTISELRKMHPQAITNRNQWKLTSSHSEKMLNLITDGNIKTRWTSGTTQKPKMWIQVELPKETNLSGISFNTLAPDDTPAGCSIQVSSDQKQWHEVAIMTAANYSDTLLFPLQKTKFIRIEQTGRKEKLFWSVNELNLLSP